MLLELLIVKALVSCHVVCPTEPDTTYVRVEIKMAEDGFMCPYLTPMFLKILEDKGSEWVVCRPQNSEVEFCFDLTRSEPLNVYTEWLTQLGYAESQIQYTAVDTLAALPALPAVP